MIGIDEAGRGPVLGSMFYAGVRIPEEAPILSTVKDSKKLTDKQRKELFEQIINYKHISVELLADDIDASKSLTELSITSVIKILSELCNGDNPQTIVVDAPHTSENKFREDLLDSINGLNITQSLTVTHKADETFPVCSAASIIAKEKRERHVQMLSNKYDKFFIGSGYPSDAKTRTFLKEYYCQYNRFPEETRTSWNTCEKIKSMRD